MLAGPLVGLLEHDGTDQARDCGLVVKDANEVGPSPNPPVESLDVVGFL